MTNVRFGIRPSEGLRALAVSVRQVQFAESLGIDSAFIGHHYGFTDYSPSPALTLAAYAGVTKRIRLGTQILILPLFHPLHVASDFAVLDVISGGRAILGVGSGWSENEFATFGVPFGERLSRMRDAIGLMRTYWNGGTEYDGRHYRLRGIRLEPPPLQSPHPPIWVGGRSRETLKLAGELGLVWMPLASVSADELDRQYAVYDTALRSSGADGHSLERPLMRHILLHERSSEAWASAAAYVERHYHEHRLANDPVMAGYHDDPQRWVRERYIVGDPDECVTQLKDLQSRFGIDHFVLRLSGRFEPERWEAQLRLAVRSIIPELSA